MQRLLAALVLAIVALAAPQLRAQDVAEFYKRNRINLIVQLRAGRRLRRLCARARPAT